MEKTVKENKVYSGKIFDVYSNTVEVSGELTVRDIIVHHGGVCVLPIDDEKNVYLVRQYRSGAGESLLEIPAGKLEKGEDILSCAVRELSEETGFSAENITSLGFIYPTPAYVSEKIYIYLAKGLKSGEAHPDEGEELDVIKLPFEKCLDMIKNGEICDAKTVVALLRAEKELI